MTKLEVKNEEKHIALSGWFLLALGTMLIFMVISDVFSDSENKQFFNTGFVVLFVGIAVFYKIKAFFNSKKYTGGYQDEFIKQMNHNAYRHAFYCTVGVIFAVWVIGDAISIPFTHETMSLVYLATASLSYGASVIWQNRD
ncbi:hypothetical protein [Pseudoalteromonas sp. MTN2-4]|uniref:hypothetical protein n=1 Tax=Pseudoalteromonas sp. MTN2-4 TaxID=3056555 RepID=UPI0036F20AFE